MGERQGNGQDGASQIRASERLHSMGVAQFSRDWAERAQHSRSVNFHGVPFFRHANGLMVPEDYDNPTNVNHMRLLNSLGDQIEVLELLRLVQTHSQEVDFGRMIVRRGEDLVITLVGRDFEVTGGKSEVQAATNARPRTLNTTRTILTTPGARSFAVEAISR